MSIPEPGKLLTIWAESGLKNEIPQAASSVTGRAGFDQGFPAINMTPKEEGGIPPFGQDFNGIFYEITKILQYMQAGGQPTFDADFAAAIGGYPAGAILSSDDGMSLFRSTVDGNSTNPNLGGDGWARPDLQVMELYRRSYAEAGYNVVGTFQAGFTIASSSDIGIDLAAGKGYTGPAGFVAPGTDPTSGGFIDRSPVANPQSTQEMMSRNLTGTQKIKTVAFSAAWATLALAIGGASWAATGVVDGSKSGTINGGFLYDAVGNQFTISGGRVSPQQFGATADVDCSALWQMCLNKRKVFLEEDIRLTQQSTLSVDNTTIDLCGYKVTCSFASADVRAIELNDKKKFKVKNGEVSFITSGKFTYGNVKGAKVYDVNFTGGTLSLQFVGEYGNECTDITVKSCTHDGSTPSLGAGGFFSVQVGRRIRVESCYGRSGGEFIDINNICSYVWITDCLSENYKQNHWDINSAWHVKIDGCTIVSTISGLTSRPVWISDTTLSVWPTEAPDRLKNSNYVSITKCNFIIENMDYTEFFIANCGTAYNPFIAEGRRLVMSMSECVFDNNTGILSNDKIKIGVVTDVIQWDIHDVTFKGAAAQVVGSGKCHDNTFDAEQEGYVGNALNVKFTDGDVADNVFYGWTGTPTASSSGGVLFARDCVGTTFTLNKFKSTAACYAPITSQNGGTNQYIENRFRMAVTDVNGVRENAGDVVIYNGA